MQTFYYSFPVLSGVHVCVSVCLSVCPLAYFRNHMVQMSPHILFMLPVAEARSILVLLRFFCVTYFRFCAQHTTSCSTAIDTM